MVSEKGDDDGPPVGDASDGNVAMISMDDISLWLQKRPLVLLRFEEGFGQRLLETRRGTAWFTIVAEHYKLEGLRLPALCLAEMRGGESSEFYIGVVRSKLAVATFQSRLSLAYLSKLNLPSLYSVVREISDKREHGLLEEKLGSELLALSLTGRQSSMVMEVLARSPVNWTAIQRAAFHVSELREPSVPTWEQQDAIETALAMFGLGKEAPAEEVTLGLESDSTLAYTEAESYDAHLFEDRVIEADASVIEGLSFITKDATGRALFRSGDEQLVVYTANRGPLEKMLGVDLIYINLTLRNIVMLQYKMLKELGATGGAKSDWVFRPDEQFSKEMARMQLPAPSGEPNDYRLNDLPFYFKFVRRRTVGRKPKSFILSKDHVTKLLKSPASPGSSSGLRISHRELDGTYLRESDLIGLVRSGYIGTHDIQTEQLLPILEEVARGNRGYVLAWQQRIANVKGK